MSERLITKAMVVFVAVLGLSWTAENAPSADLILDYSAANAVVDGTNHVTSWTNNGTLGAAQDATVVQAADIWAGTAGGPLLTTVTINGNTKPVLRFDGTSTLLGAPENVPGAGSMFVVFNNAGAADGGRAAVGWDKANNDPWNGMCVTPSTSNYWNGQPGAFIQIRDGTGGTNNVAGDCWMGSPAVGSTFEIWGITWGASGTNVYRQIGNDPGTWTIGTTTALTCGAGGIPLRIGGHGRYDNTDARSWSSYVGDMAALQVFDAQLSQSAVEAQVGSLYTAWAAVPEPGTVALLATGLIGLLAYAWRKRK